VYQLILLTSGGVASPSILSGEFKNQLSSMGLWRSQQVQFKDIRYCEAFPALEATLVAEGVQVPKSITCFVKISKGFGLAFH
jgi:hypothetical protein